MTLEIAGNTFYNRNRIGVYETDLCKEDTFSTFNGNVPFIAHVHFFTSLTQHPSVNDRLYSYGYFTYGVNIGEHGLWFISKINCLTGYLGNPQDSIEAIATGLDELLYLVGKGISTFDVNTETFAYLGDLPPDMKAEGGLTLRGDKLLLSTISHNLVELDIQNPMNSTVIMDFPPDAPPIEALYSINVTCDSTVTYAIGTSDTENKLYQIDFENQTLIEVCELATYMFGAASEEWVYPECRLHVDLDKDDSSGAGAFDFFTDTICLPPINIADEDAEVFSDIEVDSITIELMDIIDNGEEFLSLSNGANLNFIGNNSTKITLINAGSSSTLSFENALKDIQYLNNAVNVSAGTRTVVVTAYAPGYVSEPATSFILIDGSLVLDVEADIVTPSCFGDTNGTLTLQTDNGTTPYDYQWLNGATGNFLNGLSEGYYFYTVTDAVGCRKEDSIFVNQPDSLEVLIANTGSPIVCDDSGELMASGNGGMTPYNFNWQNGTLTAINDGLVAGTYLVTLTDDNDCSADGSFTIVSDTIFVNQQEIRCEGEEYIFGNSVFVSDTSFCIVSVAENSCDSIYCLDLLFLDTVLVQQSAQICQGENYNFEGSILTTDTLICIAYPLPNGCDSTVCLTLDVLENITFLADSFCQGSSYQFNNQELTTGGIYADTLLSFNGCDSIILLDLMETLPVITNMNDSFCEGDSFEWDGMIITQPGLYFDTIVGVNGCDSLLSLSLSMDLMPSVSLETTGSFCEQETVEISVQPFVSYLWSTGETNASIDVNEPGDYSVEVIDMQGCQGTANITVEEGSMVDFLYAVQEPTCFNGFDGQILIDTAFGGTPPYLYSINGQALQSANIFTNLAGGTYAILVEDVDGCRNETEIIVNQPAEIFVTLDDDQTIRFFSPLKPL